MAAIPLNKGHENSLKFPNWTIPHTGNSLQFVENKVQITDAPQEDIGQDTRQDIGA